MGFVPGSPPGTPGNMLGFNSLGFPSGSDSSFGVEDDVVPGSISLRQVAMGTVGSYSYVPSDPNFGEFFSFGNSFWDSFNPSPPTHNSLTDGTPSIASFANDTLPGN